MYLEKRKVKTGIKYYLSHTFRYFGKVRKISIYLGANLGKEELKKKRKKAEKEIGGKTDRYLKAGDPFYTEVEFKEKLLKEIKPKIKIFHLSKSEWEIFTKLFTYNTNAIEGSTLSEEEVGMVLEGEKVLADKDDIKEALGLRKAVEWIRKKPLLSVPVIKKLHRIVFSETKPFAGRTRKVDVIIRDSEGNIVHRGVEWKGVEKELNSLARWYNKNREEYHPIVLAAVVHNRFEEIHPFEDGNGRVGRLLLNLVLLSYGYPPINIDLEKRQRYYKALEKYSKNRDMKSMIKLILKEYNELKKMLKG